MFKPLQQGAARLRGTAKNAYDWLRLSEEVVLAQRTPYEEILSDDIASLRYYPPLKEPAIDVMGETVAVSDRRYAIPVVLVSPLAVNMSIYDLFPQRSFVRYLRAKGFEVYLVDWGKPSANHNDWNLYHYFGHMLPRFLERVREHSGSQKLSLHGWSFGGLFSYCYTALYQDKDIANLVMVGAPCDYHANGDLGKQYQRIARQLHRLEDKTGWRVHKSRPGWWRIPGAGNALGFKLTNPVGSARGYIDLMKNLDDRDYVINHATNASFVDRMEAYPGAVVQDFIQYLWTDNVIAHGRLPMADADVAPDLSVIEAPIFAVAGKADVIVNHDCAERLLELVSSEDKTLIDVSGGHMGILGGSKAPGQSWEEIADWLSERSGRPLPLTD
ncbi:MAG: alpha/beta fold hydrolase [Pseudomonadota bacterium]